MFRVTPSLRGFPSAGRDGRIGLGDIKIGKCGSFRGTWPFMRFRDCGLYGWLTFERLGCTLGHIYGYKWRFWSAALNPRSTGSGACPRPARPPPQYFRVYDHWRTKIPPNPTLEVTRSGNMFEEEISTPVRPTPSIHLCPLRRMWAPQGCRPDLVPGRSSGHDFRAPTPGPHGPRPSSGRTTTHADVPCGTQSPRVYVRRSAR